MQTSIISWTKHTWNPVHGCSKVSAGCKNCYAEAISLRYGITDQPWTKQNESKNVLLKAHKLREPFSIKEPSFVFVNSMSDLFHSLIPNDYRRQIFDVMNKCSQHVFQVLTKRPEELVKWDYGWSENIWMGVSVENKKATERIDLLRQSAAKLKWISFEPLLEDVGTLNLTGIDWAVVGGESGQSFREMDHAWARSIRDQCVEQGVAFFFKQSSHRFTERGTSLIESDGRKTIWQQFPHQKTFSRK